MRRKQPSRNDIWHLDEVVVSIAGRKHRLWRAVDQDGYVLDEIVKNRRNTKAAKRLLTRLLKKQCGAPKRMILLRRAMINDTLDRAKSTRYRHAARHLAECQSLHHAIPDYQHFGDHAAFLASLQGKHRRKEGFWGRVREFSGKAR